MSLAKQAVRGVAWTIFSNIGGRAVGLVGTLLLARFLDPTDYGEVMGASVLANTAATVSSLGLGQNIVLKPKAGRAMVFHVTFYSLLLITVAQILVVALGSRLGPMFQIVDAPKYLPWLAVVALLERTATIPERVLVRDMRFRVIGLCNATGEILYTVFSLVPAIYGAGGMAIIYGNVARAIFRLVVLAGAVEWREWLDFTPLTRKLTGEIFAFGLPLSVGALAGFVSRRWDNMLASRYFGPAVMGAYNYAYNLADVPAQQIGDQIGDVLLPSFARLEGDARREAMVRSSKLLALIIFPMAIGLGAIAHTLVGVLFDSRWLLVAPMLTILSILSITRPISYTTAAYLQAMNRPKTSSGLEVGKVIALFVAIVTIGRLGPLWVCVAVGVAFTARAFAGLWVLQKADQVPLARTLGGMLPPLLACAPMAAAVLGVRMAMGAHPSVLSLALEVVAGGLVYPVSALVIARSTSKDLIGLVRSTLMKRRARE